MPPALAVAAPSADVVLTMNVAAFGIGVLGLVIGAVLCLVALFKALGLEKVEDIAGLRRNGHRPD